MKARFHLLSIGLLSLLCGCGETFCPGFPEELRDWLPYQKGQTLTFANGLGDTLKGNIYEFWVIEDHYIKKCGKCGGCESEHTVFHAEIREPGVPSNTVSGIALSGGISWIDNRQMFFSFLFSDHTDYSSSSDITSEHFPKTVSPDMKAPVVITNDGEVLRFSEIRIEKGRGLVSFYDTRMDCTWMLVEDQD